MTSKRARTSTRVDEAKKKPAPKKPAPKTPAPKTKRRTIVTVRIDASSTRLVDIGRAFQTIGTHVKIIEATLHVEDETGSTPPVKLPL